MSHEPYIFSLARVKAFVYDVFCLHRKEGPRCSGVSWRGLDSGKERMTDNRYNNHFQEVQGKKSESGYDRGQEHNSHSIALLEYFQSIPQNSPLHYWPTTSELQEMKRFGLRPVNRIGDLRDGKIEHYRFDIEKIPCGHGVNRWRFHWPNRPGHPKPKNQTILPLEQAAERQENSFGRSQTHKARRSPGAWKAQPIIPTKSFEEWDRERKQPKPEPEFELTP
jgi:hypothetical protein